MFRPVKIFVRHLSTPWQPVPTFTKCDKPQCHCVKKLNKNIIDILRSMEGYGLFEELKDNYKKCYHKKI